MLCGDLSARDGCGSYVECSDVNHPVRMDETRTLIWALTGEQAGMFILNSFIAISSVRFLFVSQIRRNH